VKGFAVWLDETGERWDIKGALAGIFKARHPDFIPLGNFIEEQVVMVRAFEQPLKEWPVYGISNKDGVFLSHMQLGEKFRVPYKLIKKDWFFHNPTRANVGSLGRVLDVLPEAITSPEYQVWSIKDPNWLPEYVQALIKMPFFNLQIQVHRVGAVKERLYARNLLEIPVPDRSTQFQIALIAKWRKLQAEIEEVRSRIAVHEETLVSEVLGASGIKINMPQARPRAYALNLDEIDRWGVGFNRHKWTLDELLTSSLFPRVLLSSVARINPGRSKIIDPGTRVTFVPMEAVSETSGAIETAEEVSLEEVSKGYTSFEDGDVIWAKITPCMENGKCAVARKLISGVGFGSTEFHVIRPNDPTQVLPDYIWALLRLRTIREAAKRYFIGSAGQQRVPTDFLADLIIPLPPLNIQRSIVDGVQSKRKSIAEELASLDAYRKISMAQIEQDIISGELS
jgi:type I restriction enzyme S subunit